MRKNRRGLITVLFILTMLATLAVPAIGHDIDSGVGDPWEHSNTYQESIVGSTSEVAFIQAALNRWAYNLEAQQRWPNTFAGYGCSLAYVDNVDGYFGDCTRLAVMAFQYDHALSADGIVGHNTWKAMQHGSWGGVYSSNGTPLAVCHGTATTIDAEDGDICNYGNHYGAHSRDYEFKTLWDGNGTRHGWAFWDINCNEWTYVYETQQGYTCGRNELN